MARQEVATIAATAAADCELGDEAAEEAADDAFDDQEPCGMLLRVVEEEAVPVVAFDERQRFDGEGSPAGGRTWCGTPDGGGMRAEAEAAAAEASEEGKPMQPPSRCGSIDVPPLESFTSTGGIISAFVWRIGGEDAGETTADPVVAMAVGVVMAKRAKREQWSDGNCEAGRWPSCLTASSEGRFRTWSGVKPFEANM